MRTYGIRKCFLYGPKVNQRPGVAKRRGERRRALIVFSTISLEHMGISGVYCATMFVSNPLILFSVRLFESFTRECVPLDTHFVVYELIGRLKIAPFDRSF